MKFNVIDDAVARERAEFGQSRRIIKVGIATLPPPRISPFLLSNVLVSEQCPLPALLVIDDGRGIAQLSELAARQLVKGVMDGLSVEVFELGYPVADVVAVRIAFLGLGESVEDSLDGSAAVRRWGLEMLTKYG
jgi:antitoxin (DNA-binding transcriptional repressor) of toxin-antitoxin stability system